MPNTTTPTTCPAKSPAGLTCQQRAGHTTPHASSERDGGRNLEFWTDATPTAADRRAHVRGFSLGGHDRVDPVTLCGAPTSSRDLGPVWARYATAAECERFGVCLLCVARAKGDR